MCIIVNVTCRISRFQEGGSFQLNSLIMTGRLRILRRIVTNQIQRYKQIALECKILCNQAYCWHAVNYLITFVMSSIKDKIMPLSTIFQLYVYHGGQFY